MAATINSTIYNSELYAHGFRAGDLVKKVFNFSPGVYATGGVATADALWGDDVDTIVSIKMGHRVASGAAGYCIYDYANKKMICRDPDGTEVANTTDLTAVLYRVEVEYTCNAPYAS